MKLHQWLTLNPQMTQTKLAGLAGCSIAMINRHLLHGRDLPHEVIQRIYFITHCSVRPDDFFDLEACPENLRDHFHGHNSRTARAS